MTTDQATLVVILGYGPHVIGPVMVEVEALGRYFAKSLVEDLPGSRAMTYRWTRP